MKNTSGDTKNMKNRVYISMFFPECIENRSYCICDTAGYEKDGPVSSERSRCGFPCNDNTPSHRKVQTIEKSLNFCKLTAFNTMPNAAIPQMIPNITQPRAVLASLIEQSAIGVYVPAIKTKIVQ